MVSQWKCKANGDFFAVEKEESIKREGVKNISQRVTARLIQKIQKSSIAQMMQSSRV